MESVGWEKVHSDRERRTLRLAVPSGWLYLIIEKGEGVEGQREMLFVPAPSPAPAPKATRSKASRAS